MDWSDSRTRQSPIKAMPCKPPKVVRPFAIATVVAAAWAGAVPAAWADGRTTLTVSARVLPFTRVQVVSAPRQVTIAANDVQRGYVDVETPVQLSVSSNDPRGVLLMMASMSEWIDRADVSGPSGIVLLRRNGGFVPLSSASLGRQHSAHLLQFRLFLAKDTPPGVHAWPIQVSSQIL
jgi:hypothetical protein